MVSEAQMIYFWDSNQELLRLKPGYSENLSLKQGVLRLKLPISELKWGDSKAQTAFLRPKPGVSVTQPGAADVGHPGQTKTLELICQDYFWPKMQDDVTAFVKSCVTCRCAKACQHQPHSALQQLPIPKCPWHSLSMDFIEQLPLHLDTPPSW